MTFMPVLAKTLILLTLSNVFMTFAWYAHLKELNDKPWWIAAVVSWGVALFEYLLQVPANRIGFSQYGRATEDSSGSDHAVGLRAVRADLHKQPLKLDFLWAAPCILGAVYFVFRGEGASHPSTSFKDLGQVANLKPRHLRFGRKTPSLECQRRSPGPLG